ncbi:anti-sigma factor domain-containing protein [Salinibacterium sp. SWN1162]|uniref:anti-sigma factor n=1 Tax=Salinibacterium sp. SWN1162 TaxID=2792053 RepID=UPI0018CDF659|nr:anti-sigma factor [Salinibacterium sp. SWN1162]MBH0008603.1 anti-sigma factor [Salinibacterium sp. SWN1162]
MNDRNDDLAAQSGAYALNALSPEEREAFEKHLAASDETRTETTELSDTAVALGMAIDPVTPPPALKANLMAMIAQTPQLPREADVAVVADDASSSVDVASTPLATVTPLAASVSLAADDSAEQSSTSAAAPASPAERKAQARWFTRPATALAAVAAAVALIVTGGVVADSIGRTSIEQSSFAAGQADQLAAINAASDSQRLVSTVAGGATATFVWSGELASSAVIVDGLEALPADQVYELWYIDEAGARPAGLMNAADDGPTWRVLDGDMAIGDVVGVTIEPKGGSDAPTTDPIVVFESA